MKKIMIIVAAMLSMFAIQATAQKVHLGVGLENSHIWRGMEVNDGFITTADLNVSSNNDMFKFGLWYGTNTANPANYKEFDYYFGFYSGGFSLDVWDFNNFTGRSREDGYKIFNYRASETNHMIDATIGYSFAEAMPGFPMQIKWSTAFFGNDRVANLEGDDAGKSQNVYSTFVEINCPFQVGEKWTITPSVGTAFALNPAKGTDDAHAYGKGFGVVDLRIAATYNLEAFDRTFPITVTPMWNPQLNKGYMALTVGLLSF